jgi:hypothetical protein
MKKCDIITIFNQLTSQELADYSLFTNIIDYHFLKFRYFYYLINGIKLNKVKTIRCIESPEGLTIWLKTLDNKYLMELLTLIDKNINKEKDVNFNTDAKLVDDSIEVVIYQSNDNREDDLYYEYRTI